MMTIVEKAQKWVRQSSGETRPTTGKVREISASLYKELADTSIDHVFHLCEQLLDERSWALNIIAYDWAYRVRSQYNDSTFSVFEHWLKHYVRDWDDCDDFCTHALGVLISQKNELFKEVMKWTEHPDFWVRRGAAVSLIYSIRKGTYDGLHPLLISDALLNDDHYLVLKGYGWMLKVLSQKEPDKVYRYLLEHKADMPRLSFRYAMEKMGKDMKDTLMDKRS